MTKLIYIKANPKNESDSFSLSVARQFINKYKETHPNDEVKEIDVYKDEILLWDKDVINAWVKSFQGKDQSEFTANELSKLSIVNSICDEFMSADKYVVANPLWNFSIPPMLKAYIDNIVVAHKTFKYTPEGPIGLLKNKKAIHIQASGGVFSQPPANQFEHGDKYIKDIFRFIGIIDVQSILIEGTSMFPDKLEEIKSVAMNRAIELAPVF